MSCEAIDPGGHACTIPGRHDEQHGYLDGNGQWVFFIELIAQPIRLHQDEPVQPHPAEVGDFIPGTTVRDGTHCHACGQYCKVHRRTLSSASARALVRIHQHSREGEYVNVPDLFDDDTGHRDVSKGKYWKLLEQMPGEGEDGFALGWWRLTDLGRRFVLGEATVERYAYTFNDQCKWNDGPQWSIIDALGKEFDYDELVVDAGVAQRQSTSLPSS